MRNEKKPFYVPCLRMKLGELQALRRISADIADDVFPRLIIPPRADRDDGTQGVLFSSDSVPGVGQVLASYWRNRRAMLDATYLFEDFGEHDSQRWLPRMFDGARNAGISAIPIASLDDLQGPRASCFKASIDTSITPCFGLRIDSGAMVGAEFTHMIASALERLGLTPRQCIVVADFHDADFSQVEIVAEIIEAALQLLQEAGRWHLIAFQGTNFPNSNPADAGEDELVPRNEWHAWKRACRFDPSTAAHLLFGDYGADCAKFDFAPGGGRAIRHYRYTTPDDWLVVRGRATGKDEDVMRDVCSRIVASGHFAGEAFSSADEYIQKTARGLDGPGNSTIWREINTAHHITRVVTDVGTVRGRTYATKKVSEMSKQGTLF